MNENRNNAIFKAVLGLPAGLFLLTGGTCAISVIP
jgi:hypothetical protein